MNAIIPKSKTIFAKYSNYIFGLLSNAISWLFSKTITFVKPNLLVFTLLMLLFTGPSFYMTSLLHFPPGHGGGEVLWYQVTNWRHYVFWYFSATGSTDVIWKILGPLLIALSAGKSFNQGLTWGTAFLFLWLLLTYINADYLVNLSELTTYPQELTPAKILANLSSKPGFSSEGLASYFNNLRDLATTSVMIIIGISATNSKGVNDV